MELLKERDCGGKEAYHLYSVFPRQMTLLLSCVLCVYETAEQNLEFRKAAPSLLPWTHGNDVILALLDFSLQTVELQLCYMDSLLYVTMFGHHVCSVKTDITLEETELSPS